MPRKNFTLVPNEKGKATVLPLSVDVFTEVPDPKYIVPLTTFEVGNKRRGMAGVRFAFIAHTPRIDSLDFLINDENYLILKKLDAKSVTSWAEVYRCLDPFQEPIQGEAIKRASFEAVEQGKRAYHRFNFGDAAWCQQPNDFSAEGFRFVAQYESSNFFGSLYLFYNPLTRIARQVFQCT